MNKVINQVAYIKSSREFPQDLNQIANILTRSYVEIATAINARTIGLFPSNRSAITGNSYYVFKNQRQESFRQAYTFTTTANIIHGIDLPTTAYIASMYGQYTDGTNWYGLIAGSTVAISGQISFYLDPTNIVFVVDAGAPALTKGIIVIEWISQV